MNGVKLIYVKVYGVVETNRTKIKGAPTLFSACILLIGKQL